ncbi:MAG: hypothetical protein GYB35_00540 [Algicola sp.]|nr:hypothetical protein [Algicola sp.]
MTLALNTSFKYHSIIAIIISLWLVLFLILIAPFDIEELNFSARLEILPVYGLITFLVYVLLIPFQNWLFKKTQTWNIVLELLIFNYFLSFTRFYMLCLL